MKKKMFFIIVSVLAMVAVTIYMGINLQKQSQKTFTKGGYILDSNTTSSANEKEADKDKGTTKYYFGKDTTYKNSVDTTVEFKDTNGKSVKVPEASFIHYDDDSIGLLKKGVVLNLEDIKNTIPIYYNLYEGTILQYGNGSYVVDNLGKELKFSQFIVRVSDNKYLLVSDNIKVQLDENNSTTIKSNYVEISVVEEGIIRIENQDATYNTVATEAFIDLGNDMKLNLDNGYFFIGEEPIVNLNSMVIDSDDNVDITPIEEVKEQIKKANEEEEEAKKAAAGGGGGGGGAGGGSGTVGDAGEEGASTGFISTETEVVENALKLPTATVTDVSVSANMFQGTITINDPDSTITGPTYTYIMDNSTSRVVFEKETDQGVYSIDVFSGNLTPETSYLLVSNIHYTKNEIEYTMDVVQQLFITSSIGISIEKDYYGINELAFRLKIDDYSRVKSADVKILTTNGEVIDSQFITDENAKIEEGLAVMFGGLTANTKYNIVVNNILYQDTIVPEEYNLSISAKTLKARPTLGTPSYSIDKKNNLFTLKLNNVSDPNNGIDKYIYEVYDARTYASGVEPIVSIEKPSLGSIDLHIEDDLIERNIPYVYKVKALFYDNEKYIEYVAGPSNPFRMDGVEGPSVSWTTDETAGGITHDAIHGSISISDPKGTIDFTKNITVVFTNSIGTTTTRIFTAGNSILPINELNLRKNETYTFSVYATVDLMDNNGTVDSYHIGSVTVNTKATNPFDVFYYVQSSVNEAFRVQCKLLNVPDHDNEYEATTLSEVTFLIYDGPNTSGTLVKRLKKVDTNYHSSDKQKYNYNTSLKKDYYDSIFILNPAFFNMDSNDFTSEYYTIQIVDAKDYTDFANDIGIIKDNDFVTVQVHGFVDDPDPDSKEWFSNTLIRNKDAGDYDKYDENLAAETIVGIRVHANFDNTKKYGRYLKYTVWDYSNPDNIIELPKMAKTVYFNSDGSIDDVFYWFDYGTEYDVDDSDDTVLRRGHSYVFSFVGGLDLDNDDIAEARYPTSADKVLKSKEMVISKQNPRLLMYPSKTGTISSSTSTMTLKYLYEDLDHTLEASNLVAVMYDAAGAIRGTNVVSITETTGNRYANVLFPNITHNYYVMVNGYMEYIKYRNPIQVTYINQYFDDEYNLPNIKYSLTTDVNRVIISIDNYSNIQEAIGHIAALKITFSCPGKDPYVKDFVKLNGDNAVVDMYDISDFLGNDVKVKVEAYFDTDRFGWDSETEYVSLQAVKDIYGGGEYFTLSNNNYLVASDIARGSIYKLNYINNNFLLLLQNSKYYTVINSTPAQGGIRANATYLNLKWLGTRELSCSTDDTFPFYEVIPGISLENSDGVLNIFAGIKNVDFKASVFGFGAANIKDNLIFVQLSDTDENASFITPIGDPYQFTLDEINAGVCEITDLTPKKYYAMEFYAYLDKGGGNYEYTKLYDLNENTNTRIYYFKTLSGVSITDISVKYVPTNYSKKDLLISYTVDRVMGYEKLSYTLERRVWNSDIADYEYVPTDIQIADSNPNNYDITQTVDCSPGSGFVFGGKYRLKITPYTKSTIGDEEVWVALDETVGTLEFGLRTLKSPTVGVSASVYDGSDATPQALDFYVLFYDPDCVVYHGATGTAYENNGVYKIKVEELDSVGEVVQEVTPDRYKNVQYKITEFRRRFLVDSLNDSTNYKFTVSYYQDLANRGVRSPKTFTYVTKALNAESVSAGTVTAVANASNNKKIDLNFIDSHRLEATQKIRYSIYNSFDGTSFDNEIAFVKRTKQVGENTIYYVPLPEVLQTQGIYVIQIQLVVDNVVVDEQTIDYNFI